MKLQSNNRVNMRENVFFCQDFSHSTLMRDNGSEGRTPEETVTAVKVALTSLVTMVWGKMYVRYHRNLFIVSKARNQQKKADNSSLTIQLGTVYTIGTMCKATEIYIAKFLKKKQPSYSCGFFAIFI